MTDMVFSIENIPPIKWLIWTMLYLQMTYTYLHVYETFKYQCLEIKWIYIVTDILSMDVRKELKKKYA